MYGLITEVLGYVQSAVRYKWWSMLLAWLVALGGWVFVSQMPDVFKAETRVHVDTRSILRPLLQGMTIQPDVSSQIRLMTRLIFSRPNIEKIARMTDLDLLAKDDKSMEKLILHMQGAMKIEGGENNLFSISVVDPDPKVAKKVVQAVLTLFVEQSLGDTREDSDSAQKFLEQQIKEHELRLVAAEQAKEDYRRANYGLMQDNDLYSQLNRLATQKEETKLQIDEAMQRRDEMQRQLQNEEPLLNDSEGGGALDLRIQNLHAKMDELLLRYTDKHPEVVAAKKSIADLEREKKLKRGGGGSPSGKTGTVKGTETNPVYQQLKITLSEAEATIASLSTREKSYDAKIELLKQQMDERLRIETHLAGLNRDYETVKTNYNELLKKRETARMSGTVEQTTDSVKFRIVDPPQVPSRPSAPNRILLHSIVLVAGILLGAGLALFLSMMRPTFGSLQAMRDATGLAVLGSISMNWIPGLRKKKRQEVVKFFAASAALLLFYCGVVLLELQGVNLQRVLL